MEDKKENSFLEDWQAVIQELKELGLITEKQINTGIEIPLELIANSKIGRDFLMQILKKMHEKAHSRPESKHNCKGNPVLEYCEVNGEPVLQITEKKGITYIANTKLPRRTRRYL